ncbi:MAG: hypothetical protein OEV30_10585, partial [Ignavibacteria bacterium]|nr:hypothetical protein [Ignavibacteria bacterium]
MSNFEFGILNNGEQFGAANDLDGFFPIGDWPRGSFHMRPYVSGGMVLAAMKEGRRFVSTAGSIITPEPGHGPFNQTVPGSVGDPQAEDDPLFSGQGWRYVENPNYVVYSSLDFDPTGEDVSGANSFDWPLRSVDGSTIYVRDPLLRANYEPVFVSDEDIFCVFKDTDTRADPWFDGDWSGRSAPIGAEVQLTVYSWEFGPARDIVLFTYELFNKSGYPLDSCYILFDPGLELSGPAYPNGILEAHRSTFESEPFRNLTIIEPSNPTEWSTKWTATPIPPTIGYPLIETPRGYDGNPLGLGYSVCAYETGYYVGEDGMTHYLGESGNDSIYYSVIASPALADSIFVDFCATSSSVSIGVGPFPVGVDQSVKFAVGYVFSDDLSHLLLLDDFLIRMRDHSYQRPSPPPAPQLTAVGLNRSVKLSWDNAAESATDIIIPDSLGRPFVGYKLLRATTRDGPYVELAHWHTDTLLVYEYLDTGEDLEGGPAPGETGSGKLKNNVTYYYQLLSYDEGAPRLKLDPMSSPPVDGVNAVSVIPTTEPADATSEASDGSVVDGTLGAATAPVLIPRNTTNFNRLLSGRDLTLRLSAASNGLRYTLPVTITDSISGRVHNDVVDPELLVHGSSEVAGLRSGTATIEDVFDIGAADITFDYTFEQLSEPFHIASIIEGSSDCPIIIGDSIGTTGLQLSSPYTSAAQELYL